MPIVMDYATSAGEGDPKTGADARSTIHGKRSGDASRDAHAGSMAAETMATMHLSRISFLRKEAQKTASGLDRAGSIVPTSS